jgi:hypothetical protein
MADLLDVTKHLPSGLHDGLLTNLQIDCASSTAELHVRFMMNPRQTLGRLGRLRVSGLLFSCIDPPFWRDNDGTPVDGDDEDGLSIDAGRIADMKSPPTHLPQVPEGYWINWIYMMEPNSFLFVRGRNATFEWIEDAESEAVGGVLFPGDEIPDPSP